MIDINNTYGIMAINGTHSYVSFFTVLFVSESNVCREMAFPPVGVKNVSAVTNRSLKDGE
ncbi:MAG: hypothetical protein IMZ52_00885 [Actinobacteria bacterium]|nr:hypothetical protein [Actinomycetota bacterium]MBE3122001.1 hypothetical protein [Thermoplasmata archaeon]